MTNYIQRFDGEWSDVTAGRKVACCDCGLVHDEEYRILKAENGEESIVRASWRNNRATAARRRSLKARKEGVFAKRKRQG